MRASDSPEKAVRRFCSVLVPEYLLVFMVKFSFSSFKIFMLLLRLAAGGAEIVNAKVVGLDARAERGFDVVRQVGELEVCERAAAGADQVIVARGVVVAVGARRAATGG